jgi:hypothetical protein
MGGIDWTNIPLEDFHSVDEEREDGKGLRTITHPHGEGVAQLFMMRLSSAVFDAYDNLLPFEGEGERFEGDGERLGTTGEVPVIRDGRKEYELFDSLTLADLPAILDTLATMEEEAVRLDAERKRRRRNALSREKYKLKKLGEW